MLPYGNIYAFFAPKRPKYSRTGTSKSSASAPKTRNLCGSARAGDRQHDHYSSKLGRGGSCAQGRRAIENNRTVFNVPAETKQLRRDPSMWLAVPNCAHLSVGWAQKVGTIALLLYQGVLNLVSVLD